LASCFTLTEKERILIADCRETDVTLGIVSYGLILSLKMSLTVTTNTLGMGGRGERKLTWCRQPSGGIKSGMLNPLIMMRLEELLR
jgi:hypothetical protein